MATSTVSTSTGTIWIIGITLGVLALVGTLVALLLTSSKEPSQPAAKAAPDYEAVARDTASIIFPGSTASKEDIQQLLPSSKRATDAACDNLKHMTRDEVVSYTMVNVGDRNKADRIVDSMERNVCSRK
ncbi:hypothetical protein L3Q65_46225 [Amycolatopsis sp. FU40]|uniref:hypothetical protein n=1 Tax=Amycolatopsis sp. FU40 TaxID=2914159 RepID=UPI001F370C62|nr:hypothetical protein [Amycolatopsis sp. FU40]UKD55173.1 hypothetical protein L3Q65_46225 [Amycolatopsis sp. FU40]